MVFQEEFHEKFQVDPGLFHFRLAVNTLSPIDLIIPGALEKLN